MDKVLSWKDLKNVLTKVSGDSDNRCPSYNRVKQTNSISIINNAIVWPSGRQGTQLILNSQFDPNSSDYWELKFKNINESNIQIININTAYNIKIQATHYVDDLGIQEHANLHYKITKNNTVIYNEIGNLYENNFIKCYEIGYDNTPFNEFYNEFILTIKSHFTEIQLEVWVEGHEETKKIIKIADNNPPS